MCCNEIIIYYNKDKGITVTYKDCYIYIKSPYNSDFVDKIRRIDGRYWTGSENAIRVLYTKTEVKKALELLRECYKLDFNVEKLLEKIPQCWDGKLFVENNRVYIKLRYINYSFNSEVKELGAWFSSTKSAWYISFSDEDFSQFNIENFMKKLERIQEIAEKYYIEIDGSFRALKERVEEKLELYRSWEELSSATKPPEEINIELPASLKLYKYQLVGLYWLENVARGRGLIADEMGLGKTVEALAWLRLHKELRPVLIVCPASLKLNWRNEIRKWLDSDEIIYIVSGRNSTLKQNATMYIINYDILHHNLEKLKKIGFKVLVVDEAHYIKNIRAKRTQAVIELARNIDNVILLTGTPILNSAEDLYPQLVALKVLENSKETYRAFINKFTYEKEIYNSKLGKTIVIRYSVKNAEELNKILRRGIMLRRMKQDVFRELPEKRRILIEIAVDELKYRKKLKEVAKWLKEVKQKLEELDVESILAKVELLRQHAVALKLKESIDFIINTAEQVKKVVVFIHHKNTVKLIEEALRKELKNYKILKIIGGMGSDEKQKAVEEFNNSEKAVILLSIRAGGEGLNLQTGNVGIFVELDWTPARILQAEDRLHRIGQEKQVDYYYLIAKDTIEEKMYATIVQKLNEQSEAIDSKSIDFEFIKTVLYQELERVGFKIKPSARSNSSFRGTEGMIVSA